MVENIHLVVLHLLEIHMLIICLEYENCNLQMRRSDFYMTEILGYLSLKFHSDDFFKTFSRRYGEYEKKADFF